MKIGVIQSSAPNPSEIFVYNQIAELRKLGHEVRLFAYRHKHATKEMQQWYRHEICAPLYRPWPSPMNSLLRKMLLALYRIAEPCKARERLAKLYALGKPAPWLNPEQLYFWGRVFLNHQDLDVILAHFAPVAGVVAALREVGIVHCPLVAALHGADVTSNASGEHIASGLYPRLWREASRYTYNSSFIRDRAIAMGFPSNKFHQVQEAVGDVFLLPFPDRPDLSFHGFRVLSVGRFVEKKGHLTGLKAFKELLKSVPEAAYTIIGDGPLRGKMEQFIQASGLADRVELPGALTQDEVRKAMLVADVFLFPSETASNGDMEGQGLVVQEAQACGLPVIVTRHNGVPDGMLDGVTGYVVEERDWQAMAGKLTILAQNIEKCMSMALAGREFVMKKFSGAVLAVKLHNVLTKAQVADSNYEI
jgi:colanic acid/amylovoran biosynthesis glycosyltransferase